MFPSWLKAQHPAKGCSMTKRQPPHSLLSERLLLVDADVEVHGLDPQQHAALDLPRQRVEHGRRQRDADIEAVPVPRDDRQHVGGGAAGGLGHLKGTCSHGNTLLFKEQTKRFVSLIAN